MEKKPPKFEPTFESICHELMEGDFSAAEEHLARGNPIYYLDPALPPDSKSPRIVVEFPDGSIKVLQDPTVG